MIYDITQELFTSTTYPFDTKPQCIPVHRMEQGALYNLTDIKMCAHNGTHVDAPRHFVRDGKGIDELDIEIFMGRCRVVSHPEELLLYENDRILLRGEGDLSPTLAEALCQRKIKLLGVEGQSVGDVRVHQILLGEEIVLLEGIRLDEVSDGEYMLFCAPLKLGGCDGAPCRAILLDDVN
ncbi:MAG: cyclase family protein [Clostridia bacterium]|nr:cyclase family protein [Clostridia bacterium]